MLLKDQILWQSLSFHHYSRELLQIGKFTNFLAKPLLKIGPPFLQADHTFEQASFLPLSVSLGAEKYLQMKRFSYGASCSLVRFEHNLATRASFLAFN